MTVTGKNQAPDESDAAARALLVLGQYRRLCRMADGICRVVPLKGVSLLQSVYSERLDRDAGDIDIMVIPADKAEEFVGRLVGEGYRRQFSYLTDREAFAAKRKLALLSRNPLETDVDIHLDLVTKRFFRHHCGHFNRDAVARCMASGAGELRLDKTDEWLFLAQHACFHRFEEVKWLRDLSKVALTFSEEETRCLSDRMKRYGMERIVRVSCNELARAGMFAPAEISAAPLSGVEKRFDRLADNILHRSHPRFMARIFAWQWEILCISTPAGRFRGFFRFVFPGQGDMKAIYRTRSVLKANLLRVPHAVMAAVAVIFLQLYRIRSMPGGSRGPRPWKSGRKMN